MDESEVAALTRAAERFDDLAETADLMGDEHGTIRWRERAAECRALAMHLLDG